MDKAQHGLRALLALIPDTARVERHGHEELVRAADLEIGDVLIVGRGRASVHRRCRGGGRIERGH